MVMLVIDQEIQSNSAVQAVGESVNGIIQP